jgi:AcrR family transcriptional regulator
MIETLTNNKLSRRDRERNFKRKEILSAAVEIFAKKGYEHTKLDEIAEASEFGKGTLYNYFQNKEEIYSAILNDIFLDYYEIHQSIYKKTDTLKEFFEEITRALIHYCVENKPAFIMLVRFRVRMIHEAKFRESEEVINFQKSILSLITKRIKSAIKNKEINDVEPMSLILLHKSMVFPYMHLSFMFDEHRKIDVEKETNFILSVLFNGILINKNK